MHKKIKLRSSFQDLFGKKEDQMTPETRRERWEEWKRLASKAKHGKYFIECWTDTSACEDCKYIDIDWCLYQGLPCAVNPYLSFKTGMVGMACMGLKPKQ